MTRVEIPETSPLEEQRQRRLGSVVQSSIAKILSGKADSISEALEPWEEDGLTPGIRADAETEIEDKLVGFLAEDQDDLAIQDPEVLRDRARAAVQRYQEVLSR